MWEDEIGCPICQNKNLIPPSGPKSAKVLIIGDAPGEDEIKLGRPFVGRTGDVLRTELNRLGIGMNDLRITNLWQHAENDNEECFKQGVFKAIEQAKDRQLILLIGAATVKYLCQLSVEEYNGLEVKSSYLSAPHILACVQPTTVFHGNMLGEVRFALKNFAEIIEKEKLL